MVISVRVKPVLFPLRHTAIVIYGAEYFFGGQGIANCPPVRLLKQPSLFLLLLFFFLCLFKHKEVIFQIGNTSVIQQHTKRAESCVVKDMVMYCLLFQGTTLLGEPNAIVDLGNTEVTKDIFTEYISSLQESTYRQIHVLFQLLQICFT